MNGADDTPEFPLTVTSHALEDAWTFGDPEELLEALPVFSTDDPSQAASVIDGRGRLVRLVVENRQFVALELVAGWPSINE